MTKIPLNGAWDDSDDNVIKQTFQRLANRRLVIVPRARRFVGMNWYPEYFLIEAPEYKVVTPYQFEVRPTQPLLRVPASWWRRLGYRLLTWDWK